MNLKITTLIENMPDAEEQLIYEHGFSVFLEVDGLRLLFDTGQSGRFVENAKALGVDLSETDLVILSHGHYDHTGGVPALLDKLEKKTPFYVGKEFFLPKYKLLEDGSWKYNGNPFEKALICGENSPVELNFVDNNATWLTNRLVLLKNFSRVTAYEEVNSKFFIKTETGYEPDLFMDEISLGICTEEGLVLVVGCSHAGIINIVEHVKRELGLPITAVIGGTHLVEAGEQRLIQTVQAIKRHGIQTIAVSHCTGEAGMSILKEEFGENFILNHTGKVLNVGKNICLKTTYKLL